MLRTVSPKSTADTTSPGDEDAAKPAVEDVDVQEGEPEIPEIPDEIVPAPPAPHPAPRPNPRKRITVDEPASMENKDVLISKAQMPVPLSDVKVPSPTDVARHNLTHLPYKRWCRFCVAARCLNTPT